MDYYIMQQMIWIVKPNDETDPDYLKVYDKIFIGEDVAEYCLNMAAKTNEEIGAIVNSIENQDLKNNVADTLNQIKEMDELEDILNDGDDLPGNFVFRGKDKIYQWYLFELEEDTDEEDQTDSGNKE